MFATKLFRDRFGIPHLKGGNLSDISFAQGRVTAIDRAWQIEVDRWRAENRLSAFFGDSGLPWDRFAARVRLSDTAQQAFAALKPEDREWVEAYVAGVNIGLETGRDLAPEFAALEERGGVMPAHEPWPAWMPLGIFLVANTLASSFPNLLWREHVRVAVGPAALNIFEADALLGGGSNGWAIDGRLSASGAPLLAGDPHRVLELPGVYQQVRLAGDDFDVVGLAFPGVPGVAHFGHAGCVAWGVTNAVAHSTQVFSEDITETAGSFEALASAGPEEVEVVEVLLTVRGGEPERVRCVETARGTVIDEEMRWSILQPARAFRDVGIRPMRQLLLAKSSADVEEALRGWIEPCNRVLVADAHGSVRRGTVGRLPNIPLEDRWFAQRATEHGRLPWREPMSFETVASFAVDANERPRDRPQHDLGDSYPSPARANRISSLLCEMTDIAADDMHSIHSDAASAQARRLTTKLLSLVGSAKLSSRAKELAVALDGWDYVMDSASTAACIFAAWRSVLVERLANSPFLKPLSAPHGLGEIFDPWFDVRSRVAISLERWLDNTGAGIDGPAEMITSLEHTRDPCARWGDRHSLVPVHAFPELLPAHVWRTTAVPLSGDSDSVLATASTPAVSDRVIWGPAARWVWDLSDRTKSRWNVPYGASGVPGPHFLDQMEDWARARTSPIQTDWSKMREVPWPG